MRAFCSRCNDLALAGDASHYFNDKNPAVLINITSLQKYASGDLVIATNEAYDLRSMSNAVKSSKS